MTTQEAELQERPAGTPVTGASPTTHTGSGDINQDRITNHVAGAQNSTTSHVTGDQHQHHYYPGSYSARLASDDEGQVSYVKERRIVPGDRLVTLRRRFVAPTDFDEKARRSDIAAHGVTVLSTRPGDGAKAAAQMILAPEGREPDQDVQDVEDEIFTTGADGRITLRKNELRSGQRLLADLTRESGVALGPLQHDLEALRARVLRAGASLVVLVEHEDVEKLPSSLKDRVVPYNRPDPLVVLAQHLESRGVPGFFPVSAPEEVREWAKNAPMGGIEDFARRTEAAYRDAGYNGAIGEWLARALDAGEDALPKDLEYIKGRERAVLLAASLLEGVPVEHLAAGVESLLAQISFPEDETPLLDRKNFQEELRDCGIEVGAERRVSFHRAGRASALRTAFWDAHPRLHGGLGQWVDALVTDRVLSPADRDLVAERWAEQTLRIQAPEKVFGQVHLWATEKRANAAQAAVLLTSVLRDDRYGREGRRRIYRWAENSGLDQGTGQVLVAVCAQELAATYPEQAIVRLYLLAAHRAGSVADAARAELNTLANERPLYRKILQRVCERLREREDSTDRDLFWDLTSPERLVGGARPRPIPPDVRSWVQTGLRHVLDGAPHPTKEYGYRWFGHGEQLREILVAAAAGAGTLPALYTAALRWQRTAVSPEDQETRRSDSDSLIRRIDAAEGLDGPVDGPDVFSATRKETT